MGNRHYTDPFCWAVKDKDYERADKVLDEHIAENKPFTSSQAYFGLVYECRDLDVLWKAALHLHLFKGSIQKKLTYYDLLDALAHLKGAGRRIKFLYKKAFEEDEIPENYLDDLMAYANYKEKYDDVIKLLNKGARPDHMVSNTTVLVETIKSHKKEVFDAIYKHFRSSIFDIKRTNYEYDAIEGMAKKGVLEEFMGDKLDSMSIEEKDRYQSYLLLDLMNRENDIERVV
jgi:hypothetical protein